MNQNFHLFIQAYQQASPAVRYVIDSEIVGEYVDSLITQHAVLEGSKQKLLIILSNRLLGTSLPSELKARLNEMGIPYNVASELSDSIDVFLSDTIDDAIDTLAKKSDLEIANHEGLEKEIAEAEAVLDATSKHSASTSFSKLNEMIPPEIPRAPRQPEVTYTSTQAAILSERPATTLKPIPPPANKD